MIQISGYRSAGPELWARNAKRHVVILRFSVNLPKTLDMITNIPISINYDFIPYYFIHACNVIHAESSGDATTQEVLGNRYLYPGRCLIGLAWKAGC